MRRQIGIEFGATPTQLAMQGGCGCLGGILFTTVGVLIWAKVTPDGLGIKILAAAFLFFGIVLVALGTNQVLRQSEMRIVLTEDALLVRGFWGWSAIMFSEIEAVWVNEVDRQVVIRRVGRFRNYELWMGASPRTRKSGISSPN